MHKTALQRTAKRSLRHVLYRRLLFCFLAIFCRSLLSCDSRTGQIKNPPSECSGSNHSRHSY